MLVFLDKVLIVTVGVVLGLILLDPAASLLAQTPDFISRLISWSGWREVFLTLAFAAVWFFLRLGEEVVADREASSAAQKEEGGSK